MRPRHVLACLGSALLAAPALAQAPSAKPVAVADPAGDVSKGAPDLRRLTFERTQDGRLRAVLSFASALRPQDLQAESGPPGSVCLKVWARNAAPDEVADRLVCATATRSGRLRGEVLEDRANSLPRRVAEAGVSRASSRRWVLRFSQTSIGRPARVSVQAETTRAGCPRTSCIDNAPDAGRSVRLTLRRAR